MMESFENLISIITIIDDSKVDEQSVPHGAAGRADS